MQPFAYEVVTTAGAAVEAGARGRAGSTLQSRAHFLAGRTTLIDLMQLNVMRPEPAIDINPLTASVLGRIDIADRGIRLGALVRMAEAADHPQIRRTMPAVAQSLELAASGQIRNMASLGGNVLQRTRCPYFRDVSYRE